LILFEKYGQHQPLTRQSERYGREGVDLSLSTLADDNLWRATGSICQLFSPSECWNFFKKFNYVAD